MEVSKNKAHNPGRILQQYSFILFVVNDGDNSLRAMENLEKLCQKWLNGRYQIKVVDVVKNYQTALDYNILLTPSVVVDKPESQKIIHGDLSDPRKFLAALNIYEKDVI